MTPATVISQTACAYGLAIDDLAGRSRERRVQEARAVAAWLAYELTDASYAELAEELGARRRQTVCEIIATTSERLTRRDRRITRAVERIEGLLAATGDERVTEHGEFGRAAGGR